MFSVNGDGGAILRGVRHEYLECGLQAERASRAEEQKKREDAEHKLREMELARAAELQRIEAEITLRFAAVRSGETHCLVRLWFFCCTSEVRLLHCMTVQEGTRGWGMQERKAWHEQVDTLKAEIEALQDLSHKRETAMKVAQGFEKEQQEQLNRQTLEIASLKVIYTPFVPY